MTILRYIFAPKLFMEYGMGSLQKMYEPGGLEKFGDQILSTLSMMWNIGYYSSPLIVTFLYRRGYLVADSISSLAKFTTSIGIIVVLSMCMRGIGRSQSRSYNKLVKALEQARSSNNSEEAKKSLRLFDFDFKYWSVDFDVLNLQYEDGKKISPTSSSKRTPRQKPFWFSSLPCEIAAYIAIHTFGIRMIYPGSVKLLQSYLRPMLVAGRAKLIEEEHGMRYKVKTVDRNDIDTVFVDNRNKSINGKTIVICSEGNAGFYEIGIMSTPLSLKYSVLGWNHPGFEGSTGQPFPDQDKNAIDAVVQFAIHKLGFAVENILFFGWSIGGYSSIYAASQYPEIKGIILDATFDDVLHLATPRMPASLSGIVRLAIREYVNLHNSEMLMDYGGPVLLIRRTEDEIIAEDNRIETNRGNYLLLNLLKYRYPNIFQSLQITRIKNLLTKPIDSNANASNDDLCMSRLITYASDKGKTFPMAIGEDYNAEVRTQMAEFLLKKHFRDYKSTHCTPLPDDYFTIPWDIPTENGFVFT
ncbi:phosphatidylserine lipase ABHD16A [Eupeodes corollae]|uniref:phosphatidylserine lipase ABHD16A n=1 Tax=Eupeodes corollae TaxID=290404 RepID=UPI00248FAF76|nr:phosphatidylserine lipase ABHD16A [Eupeodes corollae]